MLNYPDNLNVNILLQGWNIKISGHAMISIVIINRKANASYHGIRYS